jgi:hypothetical protein
LPKPRNLREIIVILFRSKCSALQRRATILLAATIPAIPTLAEVRSWNLGTPVGHWSALESWTDAQPPAAGDEVHLNSTGDDLFQATFDLPAAPTYGDVYVQDSTTGSVQGFQLAINDPLRNFAARNLFVGDGGAGRVVQSAGNVNLTDQLTLGYQGGTGTYELSGGNLTSSGQSLGGAGTGKIIQSGGINTVNGDLFLDAPGTNASAYILSGTGFISVSG